MRAPRALVLSRFSFALRGRALLWLAALAALPLLEPWRAPALLAGALAGYVFFTVVVWGSVYYHLRTGAPWTNGLRFWRLVLTNSDPTSGNALEQLPKLLIALSAGTLLAEDPGAGSLLRVAAAVAIAAVLGALAARSFARRLPRYPERAPSEPAQERGDDALARRVYVIVVDGCNRGRLWQADAPVMDRLAREGTEYLAVEPAYPARTVVCFSSMLTGATPAEHGMRSNFAPRLGVRRESIFDVLDRKGRRGRLVGIAHLLDPFGEEVVRSVTSVQPTSRIDASLVAEGRRVVEEEDPDLLVLQLLAADQLGHVRGVRSPEYLDQLAETDRHVGGFLDFLEESGRLDGATVILMADHGQGRGIGGHGHLDWGERPVPFVVWGEGALPGTISREPRSVLELAATIARLLGVPQPEAARGRPLVPAEDASVGPRGRARRADGRRAASPSSSRATRSPPSAACLPASRQPPAGCRWTCCSWTTVPATPPPRSAASTARASIRLRSSRGLGAALRTGLEIARDEGYAAALYIDGDGEYDPAELEQCPRAGRARTRGLRARLALPRPARGHVVAPNAREPLVERAAGNSARHGHERCPDRLPRVLGPRARRRAHPARLQLRAGAHASHCGAPASTRWRSRSATGAARAGARSCATPSTSREWRPPSGASGAPRAPRAGPAAARRHPPRPPARTASRRRARTAAADR